MLALRRSLVSAAGGATRLPSPEKKRAEDRGSVEFPDPYTFLVFENDREGPVVAEVGAANQVRRVSLRPGRYFVRGRTRDHLLEGQIRVAVGEEQQVRADDMERIGFARLVRKGRHPRGFTHGPQAGYSVRTPLWAEASLCHGIFAGYSMDFHLLTAALDFAACRSTFYNRILSANADDFGVDARISYAWDWRWLTLQLGVSVGASWLRQTFSTRGLAPDRNSVAGRLAALGGFEAQLPWGLYAVATVAGQTYVLQQQRGNDADDTGNTARFVARTSVGLGKRF